MLKHQEKCTEGLVRYYRDKLPDTRKKIARAGRVLATFGDADEVLSLEEMSDKWGKMYKPRIATLRADLTDLGIKVIDDFVYRADVLHAIDVFSLSVRRPPLRFLVRQQNPYRQQAALAMLLLTKIPEGAEQVVLTDILYPRTSEKLLRYELERMKIRPIQGNIYRVSDIEHATRRWIHAPGNSDLSDDMTQMHKRLTGRLVLDKK